VNSDETGPQEGERRFNFSNYEHDFPQRNVVAQFVNGVLPLARDRACPAT